MKEKRKKFIENQLNVITKEVAKKLYILTMFFLILSIIASSFFDLYEIVFVLLAISVPILIVNISAIISRFEVSKLVLSVAMTFTNMAIVFITLAFVFLYSVSELSMFIFLGGAYCCMLFVR